MDRINTGLIDKNGTPILIGDKTRLVLDDGEVREFDVRYKTVIRTVKSHPDFDDEYARVAITGVVFNWNGFDLFPCVDEAGICDTAKMEVINSNDSKHPVESKWKINSDGYYPYCSCCMREPQAGEMTDYCPNCGAKMGTRYRKTK